jgi:hypothetical protein
MGDNGNRLIVSRKDKPWYEGHPSRPSARALPVLTIIFWASEDGSLSRAIGWLKEVIPDDLQRKKLNQAIHKHVESILAEMIRSGVVQAEEGKFALAKERSDESAAQLE